MMTRGSMSTQIHTHLRTYTTTVDETFIHGEGGRGGTDPTAFRIKKSEGVERISTTIITTIAL